MPNAICTTQKSKEKFGVFLNGMDILFPIVSLSENENIKIMSFGMSTIFVKEWIYDNIPQFCPCVKSEL